MNNIFESTEPIEEWMDKHFKSLKYIMVACPPTERFEAFRNKVREWLHQHDHSKEVEIRALYDELHSLKRECETAAGEGMKMLEEMEYTDEQRKKDIREADIKFGSQDPKASEVLSADALRACEAGATSCLLSEKLERISNTYNKVVLEYDWLDKDWYAGARNVMRGSCRLRDATGSNPLEAVQALEEQLKEGS